MISCTRLIQFSAGHRVVGHENKCANVHGHNYIAEIYARAERLDEIGRVIDFSVLKEKVGGWIDRFWDHTFIFGPNEDAKLVEALLDINNKDPYRLLDNPTAENMANFLLLNVCKPILKDSGVEVYKVVIWETPNCFATAEL